VKLYQNKLGKYVVCDKAGKIVIITHHSGTAKAWLEKGKRDGNKT
jgi:hypothetical protein